MNSGLNADPKCESKVIVGLLAEIIRLVLQLYKYLPIRVEVHSPWNFLFFVLNSIITQKTEKKPEIRTHDGLLFNYTICLLRLRGYIAWYLFVWWKILEEQ